MGFKRIALYIVPLAHEHFWQTSAKLAERGDFRPQRGDEHHEVASTHTAMPRELDGGSSQLPLDLKGWGGGGISHFSFRWRFARGLYNDFRNVSCKAFRTSLQGVLQGFLRHVYKVFCKAFRTCLQGVLQGQSFLNNSNAT